MMAMGAVVAGSNIDAETNGGSIGGANPAVAWVSSSYTPKLSGRLLVIATITGNDATVSEAVTYALIKNATASVAANIAGLGGTSLGPAGMITEAGLHGDFGNTICWVTSATDTPPRTGVTLAIAAAATHNLTVPIGGASIVIIELP